jgi:hypothetical protein
MDLDNTPVISVGHIPSHQHQAHYPGWKDARLMPPPEVPAGPSIITPRLLNDATPPSSLNLLGQLKIPVKPGYLEAHQFYDDIRKFMAKIAYQSDNTELISLKVMMKVSCPGKVKPLQVGVC